MRASTQEGAVNQSKADYEYEAPVIYKLSVSLLCGSVIKAECEQWQGPEH